MKQSVYKSQEQRDIFRSYYHQILTRFPFEQKNIQTALGQTFLLASGQESKPPVILLHGSCSNSAFWFPEMAALSNDYRVYAVDLIGEAGNSEEYRPDLDSDDFAHWMRDVLNVLNIEKASLVGNSLGGWVALKFATAYPERVYRLCLLASAGLADVRPQFMSAVKSAKGIHESASVESKIIGENNLPKEVLDFMNLIIESYNPIPHLPIYADEQLYRLNMPVLFVDGEDDVIIDASSSAQRLSKTVPSAEIHILANCGHVLANSIEYILPFFAKTGQPE